MSGERFQYVIKAGGNGPLDEIPLLPIRLSLGSRSIKVEALIDSGATVSVLPLDVGAFFGLNWNSSKLQPLAVGGAHGAVPAKRLDLMTTIGSLAPRLLAFAWVNTNNDPLVLGNADFFFHFDVFLCRRHSYFVIQPATP